MENPFDKKESRADFRYIPQVSDLQDVMYTGDLSNEEERELLSTILGNYIHG